MTQGPGRGAPLEVRSARAEDHARVAELFLELETGETPPSRARFDRELLGGTFVAERAGRVVGYLYAQVLADSGYVRHVVCAPEARRAGVAAALVQRAKQLFRASGCATVRLNVKPENAAAIALYRREGLAPAYRSRAIRLSFAAVPGEPCAGVREGVLDPARDAEADAAFMLPAGQIAAARALGRVIVALLRDPSHREPGRDQDRHAGGGEIVGIACFDPSFPGAFPFRVKDPTLGPTLLHACRPHAIEDTVQLVLEGDDALAAWFEGEGAETRFEFDHYVGRL